MKKYTLILLAVVLMCQSCTNLNQFYGAATGSSLGGMFGSAIGGLMGGPRGSDTGTVIGMVAGGIAGAAASSSRSDYSSSTRERAYTDEVAYDYTPQTHYSSSTYRDLVVRDVTFNDENGNHSLDSRERAYIIIDIFNEGRSTAHDVAPLITSDNRRIVISPTAIISTLPGGRGARYKAAVTSRGHLKNGIASFTVSFDGGRTVAKHFTIKTRK
ncbi:MAG: hypothetical protein IJ786_03485 [Bacteroidaceae bacterium]|nr:hypothetical protein [Bacteroidaceae bacterium]